MTSNTITIEGNIVFNGDRQETEAADTITRQLAKVVEEHADHYK